VNTLLSRAAAIGLDLEAQMKSDLVEVRAIDPAELSPGEFTHDVCKAVEQRGVNLVIIDSLNGYMHAMPEEQFLTLQLHELLMYLAQMGVATMMVVAQHGFLGSVQAPLDVSYLADAVMLFRHYEAGGRLHKAISMVKKRTGAHESTIRELTVGPVGVTLGKPLERFRGVMTGVPSQIIHEEKM
jgi:circadian clock protein KaiC